MYFNVVEATPIASYTNIEEQLADLNTAGLLKYIDRTTKFNSMPSFPVIIMVLTMHIRDFTGKLVEIFLQQQPSQGSNVFNLMINDKYNS